jgi:hypothetical protein
VAKPRKQPLGQTIGGVLFGFEQQILRNSPPPEELVRHARPDASVPAGDGTMLTIELPEPAAASEPAEVEPPARGAPEGASPR